MTAPAAPPPPEPPGSSGPPSAPALAAQVFGPRLPLAVRFVELLAGAGVERGLLGPREVPRLWDRHLLNCAVVTELVPQGLDVVDVGSGAGLPGLVWAIARPDLQLVLVEPLLRRATFLSECASELGLDGVEVLRGRAEEVAATRSFTGGTARAVAPLDRLLGWTLPLLRPGGSLWAFKGRTAEDELRGAAPVLRRLGARDARVVLAGEGVLDEPTTVVLVTAGAAGGTQVRGGGARRTRRSH